MKYSRSLWTHAALLMKVALATIFITSPLFSQYFRGYVYTYYDAPTDTLYAQAINQGSYTSADYYYSGVTLRLYLDLNDNFTGGTLLRDVSVQSTPGSYSNAEAFVQYHPAIAGRRYTVIGNHSLRAIHKYLQFEGHDCYNNCKTTDWFDIDGYSMLAPQPYPPTTSDYTAYAPQLPVTKTTETVIELATVDREQPSPCGNPQIDAVYGEYRDPVNGTTHRPGCAEFTTSTVTTNFSWGELNVSNDHQYGIFSGFLTTGVECVRRENGNTPLTITSSYRNPNRNMRQQPSAPNSRHIFGDAVDFSAPAGSNLRRDVDTVGRACNVCREPPADTPTWVHYDWRPFSSCTATWRP